MRNILLLLASCALTSIDAHAIDAQIWYDIEVNELGRVAKTECICKRINPELASLVADKIKSISIDPAQKNGVKLKSTTSAYVRLEVENNQLLIKKITLGPRPRNIDRIYPRKLLENSVEGSVRLRFTVLESGSVSNVLVLESDNEFVKNHFVKKLKGGKYVPETVDGTSIKTIMERTFSLNIEEKP